MPKSEQIKMEYDLMEAMSKTFNEGAQELEQTNSEVQKLASILEEGALLGKSGEAFVEVLKGKMSQSIKRLNEKFGELKRDIDGAVKDMREADQESKGKFF